MESFDGYSKAWARFSVWVVGNGLMCACADVIEADGAFHTYVRTYPDKNVLVYELESNTCIMQRLAI